MNPTTARLFPLSGRLVGATILGLIVAYTPVLLSLAGWIPASWPALDRTIREDSIIPALVVAVVAALAGRRFTKASAVFGPASGRGQTQIVLRAIGLLVAVALATQLMIVAGLGTLVLSGEGHGPVPGIDLASHLLSVCVAIPLGMLCGRFAPSRVWGVLACLVTAATLLVPLAMDLALTNSGHTPIAVSALWGLMIPGQGWRVPVPTSILRLGYYAALLISAAAIAALLMRRRRDVCLVLAPLVLIAVALSVITFSSPGIHLAEPGGQGPVCRQATPQVQVCMSQDNASLLPGVVTAVGAMLAVIPADFHTVIEDLPGVQQSDDVVLIQAPQMARSRGEYYSLAGQTVADRLTHVERCYSKDENWDWDASRSLAQRLEIEAGLTPVADGIDTQTHQPVLASGLERLRPLSTKQLSEWVARNSRAIAACELRADDLP